MGGANSRNSLKAVSTKTENKITSPGLKDKNFSLEAFVTEMVKQLVEQKVKEIVEEERRKVSIPVNYLPFALFFISVLFIYKHLPFFNNFLILPSEKLFNAQS